MDKKETEELIAIVIGAGPEAQEAWNELYRRDVEAVNARKWTSSSHLSDHQLHQMLRATKGKIPAIAKHIASILGG